MKYQVNKRAIHQNYFSGGSPLMEKKSWWNRALDYGQNALSVAGMIPGFGAVPDALNTVISGGRIGYAKYHGEDASKYYADLALNAAAIIPGAGQAATLAKFAKNSGMVGKAVRGYKAVDNTLGGIKAVKQMQNLGKGLAYTTKTGTKMLNTSKAHKLIGSTKTTDKVMRGAYNFVTQKGGLVPIMGKGIPKILSKTAHKTTSAIGGGKIEKSTGLFSEGYNKVVGKIEEKQKSNEIERMNKAIMKNTQDPNKVYAGDSGTNPKPTIRKSGWGV